VRGTHSAHVRRGARGPGPAPGAAAAGPPAPGRPRAPGARGRTVGPGPHRHGDPAREADRPGQRVEDVILVPANLHRLVSIHYHTAYFSG